MRLDDIQHLLKSSVEEEGDCDISDTGGLRLDDIQHLLKSSVEEEGDRDISDTGGLETR